MAILVLILIICWIILAKNGAAMTQKKVEKNLARQESAARAEAERKAQADEKSRWEKAQQQYNILTSLLTFDEACTDVQKLAASKLSARLAPVINSGLIPRNCVNTYSSLGICCVASDKMYYDIKHSSGLGGYLTMLSSFAELRPSKVIAKLTPSLSASDCLYELRPKEVHLSSMKLSDIKLYRIEGGVHYNSNVSGGGVNMQGAMAGAILAGGAAAIIGSQIGTEIKTTTTKQDERRLMLYLEEKGTLKMNYIQTDNIDKTLDALRKLIPEKEESYILAQNRLSALQN